MKKHSLLLLLALTPALDQLPASEQPSKPPNILFIFVDDLRAQLGCYGADYMVTPHLDKLASQSRLFKNQFVQAPSCGPSRCSVLTGRYPRRNDDLTNYATFSRWTRLQNGSPESAIPTMPEFFKLAGYQTIGLGKIGNTANGTFKGSPEFPNAWDSTWGPTGIWGTSQKAIAGYANGKTRKQGITPPTERGEVDDHGYPDALIADEAIAKLQSFDRSKPFFLAVGIFKPHLPFVAPAKYWDLYDREKIPVPTHTTRPAGTPIGLNGELSQGYGGWVERGKLTVDEEKLLRHAYAASISYIDAQIGRVLDSLDSLGLADDTIVVVWGDHGWHLGELGTWGKQTLMDWALRSTLIIHAPGQASPGVPTDAVVEAVDLYPTLAALCGLTPPQELDGTSLQPLIDSPSVPFDHPALSWWYLGPGIKVDTVGRSIRTSQWRYTQWDNGARELYDQVADPDESVNLATDPRYNGEMQTLRDAMQRLSPPWQASALPDPRAKGDIDP